jgi:hypothetical protein
MGKDMRASIHHNEVKSGRPEDADVHIAYVQVVCDESLAGQGRRIHTF